MEENFASTHPLMSIPSSSLFDTFPPEILCHIFRFVRDNEGQGSLFRLTHICRRWRIAASEFPALWSKIHLNVQNYDSPLLKLQLERARAAPLTVIWNRIDQSRVVPLLKGRSFKRLAIGLWPAQFEDLSILRDPAPVLRKLTLTSLRLDDNEVVPQRMYDKKNPLFEDIFCGHAPLLAELMIQNCQLYLSLPYLRHFTSLKSLQLIRIPFFARPTLSEYCETLQTLGWGLEFLKLADCLPTSGRTAASNNARTFFPAAEWEKLGEKHVTVEENIDPSEFIQMPRLRELFVQEFGPKEDQWTCLRAAQVARRIIIPNSATYTCHIQSPPLSENTGSLEQIIKVIHRGLRSLIPAALRVSLKGQTLQFKSYPSGVRISTFFVHNRPCGPGQLSSFYVAAKSNIELHILDSDTFHDQVSQHILNTAEPLAQLRHLAAVRRSMFVLVPLSIWASKPCYELSFDDLAIPPAIFCAIGNRAPYLQVMKVTGKSVPLFIRALRAIRAFGKIPVPVGFSHLSTIVLSDHGFDSSPRLYRSASSSDPADTDNGTVAEEVWRTDVQALADYLTDRARKGVALKSLSLRRCTNMAQGELQRIEAAVKTFIRDKVGVTEHEND